MQRLLILLCFITALSACGSGKGGSSGGPTKPETPAITVNAGPDKVVNVGEKVTLSTDIKVVNAGAGSTLSGSSIAITSGSGNFEVTGSSSTPSDIVKLSWTRLEGPAFSISRSDSTSGNFWFTAPEVGAAGTVDIVYRLSITNAAGTSASDTVKITVKAAAGSSSSSSSSNSSSSNSSSSGVIGPVLSGSPLAFTADGELMDTTKLPSPLAEVNDSIVHQPELAAEAAIGFYSYGDTQVLNINEDSDCPFTARNAKTCPYFKRIRIATDGTIRSDSWAYYPVQKKWIALKRDEINPVGSLVNAFYEGASWLSNNPLVQGQRASLTPMREAPVTGPWGYSYGNVEYQLSLNASAIAGQAISGAAGITYPSGAKSVVLSLEQKAGVLYTLEYGGLFQDSDDGKQYASVAALRAAHAAISTPLCLAKVSTSALIYFDSTTHAAGIVYSPGICNSTIESSDVITAVESGVITLAGRAVIATQIPNSFFGSNKSNREKQVLALVGLNAAAGNAANGLAYLPGYTTTFTGYQNQAAFMAWLNTKTSDPEAHALP